MHFQEVVPSTPRFWLVANENIGPGRKILSPPKSAFVMPKNKKKYAQDI